MGDEFYAILKLVSGEEVLSLVCIDNTTEVAVVVLQNPVILKYINKSRGTLLKLEPWIKFSSDDFFVINLEKIITMTEIKDKNMIKFYEEYLVYKKNVTDFINERNKRIDNYANKQTTEQNVSH